jgi:hypothetical protein
MAGPRALLVLAAALPLACARPAAGVRVERAVLVLPAGTAPAPVYFTVRNDGAADTLTGIGVDAAAKTTMHDERRDATPMDGAAMGGMMTMTPVAAVPLPAGGEVRFAPGGLHGMIERLDHPLARGGIVTLTLHLSSGRTVTTAAHVIAYADLDTALATPPRR